MKNIIAITLLTLLTASSVWATTNKLEVLTVREDGIPAHFTNTLGTVSQMAQLQAQLLINAKMAQQAEQIYGQTTGTLQKVATQLANQRAVGYADYFIVSFERAMIIDGRTDKVYLFKWEKAPAERQKGAGYESWDCYYAFKSESHTDIQQLKQIFKVSGALDVARTEWSYLSEDDVDDPVPMGSWTDPDGVEYDFSYRTTVHLPSMTQYFLIINIKDQAADADGSTIYIYGGDAGGITGERTLGNTTIEFSGGRAFGWRAN